MTSNQELYSAKNSIKQFINNVVKITQADWNEFDVRLQPKTFEKDEILCSTGEVENYIYFIYKGVSRIFQLKNNLEYTLRFNFPISVFNSYASFITRSPSLINVQAISEVKTFRISWYDMESLYDNAPNADRIGRKMIELLYLQRELKELQMHSKTAEDYYKELLGTNANLTIQIPQKYLASYLGITPESLSRIKRKLSKS